ncbi:MAG: penicillin-binding protein 2 [Candidatus Doudnabacteria bacterium]|nr:penicillin-binding protein 2 [bacterium]MDZ4243758.1 penicillin-binding protein 2 [Candidatus Doudnabacteria bacterium]
MPTRRRLVFLSFIFVIFTAAVIVRLFALQVLGHSYFQSLAENQHQLYKDLIPARGKIFIHTGKNGEELIEAVGNIQKDLIYAVPPEITDKEKTAKLLGQILEIPKAEILAKISEDERKWVALKKQLPENVSLGVKKLDLPGIYLQPEDYRFYPEKSLASQVLGFLAYEGDKRMGQYGVERYFEDILAGKPGSLLQEKDASGGWITGGIRKLEPAVPGGDIVLTVNRAIQFQAESILSKTVRENEADSGSIVVLDPGTGAVLAMANYPDFDPNIFNEVQNPGAFRNLAVTDAYEPGSVFKAFTMALALDGGAISPEDTFEDTGSVQVNDRIIKNANEKTFGRQTMTQILEQSINTGAVYLQQKAGKEKFAETIKRFGFGKRAGITLPGESAGDLRNLTRNADIDYATASFGQGITVTPLQLAQAYAAIANQGKMMKPYIEESIRTKDGIVQTKPEEIGQAVSPKTANIVAAMLVSVVENGHGKRARVPGYYLGGKTGTAQVARADGPVGYDPNLSIGTFAGFGPIEDPKFVIVVKIDNPKTVRFAESTAAPAFGELAKFLLDYFQIRPTR